MPDDGERAGEGTATGVPTPTGGRGYRSAGARRAPAHLADGAAGRTPTDARGIRLPRPSPWAA